MKFWDRSVLILLGFLALVICAERLHTVKEPLECDTALFSVLAHEWTLGRPLYSDLWDNKPPGLIVTYALAQKIAGYGPGAIFLLSISASIFTLLGVYAAVLWMTADRRAGIWAAVFWTLANANPYLEANQPASEVFVNAFWIWGYALLFRAGNKEKSRGSLWAAGCFLAAASFYKHPAALANGMTAIGFAALRMKETKEKISTFCRTSATVFLPTAGLWAILFCYFFLTHRFSIFWNTLVTYSYQYAQNGSSGKSGLFFNVINSLRPSILASAYDRRVFYVLAPLAAAAVPGLFFAFKRKNLQWIFAWVYAASAWITMAISGRFYPHYYQLLLPPLVVLAGLSAHLVKPLWPILIASFLFLREAPFYRLSAEDWSRLKYGEVYITIEKMGLEIGQNLQPSETFYELGYEPGLYYYSRRSPPTGILMADHWEIGPSQQPFMERIRQDLVNHKPELLVTTRFWISEGGHAQLPLAQWCFAHYRPLPGNSYRGPFLLLVRVSDVQMRTRSHPARA